jgi:hypothetical protein
MAALMPARAMLSQAATTAPTQTFVLRRMDLPPAEFAQFGTPAKPGAPTCSDLLRLYAEVLAGGTGSVALNTEADAPCNIASVGFEYLIVNFVDWGANETPSQPYSTWYLLSPANPRKPIALADATSSLRIFGSARIGVLFIHRHLADADNADIQYTLTATHQQSAQAADLSALLNLVAGPNHAAALAPKPDGIMAVAATVGTIPKLPDSLVFAGQAFQDKATETSGGKPDGTFTQTYVDEGYARWDVSAAIPIVGIKDVQYSQTGATVQPKTVTRANAYALAHFYPVPVDLKGGVQPWYPSLVAGVPISGAPLDKPFVGMAMGMKKPLPLQVNFFAGAVFNKVFTEASTTNAALLNSHRVTKLLYGIDIPVGTLVKAIAGK